MASAKVVEYDSFKDEKRQLTVEDFRAILMDELLNFSDQVMEDRKSPLNEEQKKITYTFNEWMRSFRVWASF